jgi:hypothetical protein
MAIQNRRPEAGTAFAAVIATMTTFVAPSACQRASSPPPGDEPLVTLPDMIAGFEAGPPSQLGGATRRAYRRGGATIGVTMAQFPMTAAGYDGWVKASVEGYPQATLPIPPGAGNGFYQCAAEHPEICDLLIQLRSGVHFELRGNGNARREDVDAVARGLRLSGFAR